MEAMSFFLDSNSFQQVLTVNATCMQLAVFLDSNSFHDFLTVNV